jgi:release factor glutamine methyltransferase
MKKMEGTSEIEALLASGLARFMGHELHVEPGVLVPRAVSEVLVRAARAVHDRDAPLVIVDMGCGSGNVGIALAHAFPRARVYSTDLSAAAVALTAKNVKKHGLEDRVEVRQGDLFAPLAELEGTVDLVTCSPPFISSGKLEKESAHLLVHEPREAFDAGPYGIALHQRLVKESVPHLRAGSGWLVLEHGEGQDKAVQRLVERTRAYDDARPLRCHEDRFVAAIAARRARPALAD